MSLPPHSRGDSDLRKVADDPSSPVSFDSQRIVQSGTTRENNNGESPQEGSTQGSQPQPHITKEQLVNEVRGIYAGLVMVEKKCIEINKEQSESPNKLSNLQWQALVFLHRTLLHEHQDFFLASQHPSASLVLEQLSEKICYARTHVALWDSFVS